MGKCNSDIACKHQGNGAIIQPPQYVCRAVRLLQKSHQHDSTGDSRGKAQTILFNATKASNGDASFALQMKRKKFLVRTQQANIYQASNLH